MAKKRSAPRSKKSRLGRLRLPPWLFYTIVVLVAAAAAALVGWTMFHPTA